MLCLCVLSHADADIWTRAFAFYLFPQFFCICVCVDRIRLYLLVIMVASDDVFFGLCSSFTESLKLNRRSNPHLMLKIVWTQPWK